MKTIKTLALVAVFAAIGGVASASDCWNNSYNHGRYDDCFNGNRYHPVYSWNDHDRDDYWRRDFGTAYRFHDYDYLHRGYYTAPRYGYNWYGRW